MNTNPTTPLNARLVAYTALAAAGAAVTAVPAQADIIYSGPVNLNIPSTTQGIYLNIATGASTTGGSSGLATWDINAWSSTGLGLFNPATPAGGAYVNGTAGGTAALNLAMGTFISSASLFGSNSSAAASSSQ
nr:hypothetical protein [Verrucomicrobiota bacterium]